MAKLYNIASMSTATTGTGTITLGSASTGYRTFAAAHVQDGDVIDYIIQEGNNREVGFGTYTASGTTLTRNVISSTNSDAAITLAGAAVVAISPNNRTINPVGPVTTIASATTTDLSTGGTAYVHISGTTTITSFGTVASILRYGTFTGILTLTYNATSLILPTAANITTAAGDSFVAVSDGSGNWTVLDYQRADGSPILFPALTGDVTTTLGAFATTIAAGAVTFAKMASAAIATSAQFLANTASLILTTDQVWASAAPVTITYAATTTIDFSTLINGVVALTGNVTFAAPSNTKAGQSGVILIKQDSTGSRTATWNSVFKWPGGSATALSTAASSVDKLYYFTEDSTHIHVSLEKASA